MGKRPGDFWCQNGSRILHFEWTKNALSGASKRPTFEPTSKLWLYRERVYYLNSGRHFRSPKNAIFGSRKCSIFTHGKNADLLKKHAAKGGDPSSQLGRRPPPGKKAQNCSLKTQSFQNRALLLRNFVGFGNVLFTIGVPR